MVRVEEDRSGRASCRECRSKISYGDVRVGVYATGDWGPYHKWHHAACYHGYKKSQPPSSFPGWSRLSAKHQSELIQQWNSRTGGLGGVSGPGRSYTGSTSQSSSALPAAPAAAAAAVVVAPPPRTVSFWSPLPLNPVAIDGSPMDEERFNDACVCYGSTFVKVVGTQYYEGVIHAGEMARLMREPHNPYDQNAIRVTNMCGAQVGHINRHSAAALAPIADDPSPVAPRLEVSVPGAAYINQYHITASLAVYGLPEHRMQTQAYLMGKGMTLHHGTGEDVTKAYDGDSSSSSSGLTVATHVQVDVQAAGQAELDALFDRMAAELDALPASHVLAGLEGRLTTTLLPHQLTGVAFMVDREAARERTAAVPSTALCPAANKTNKAAGEPAKKAAAAEKSAEKAVEKARAAEEAAKKADERAKAAKEAAMQADEVAATDAVTAEKAVEEKPTTSTRKSTRARKKRKFADEEEAGAGSPAKAAATKAAADAATAAKAAAKAATAAKAAATRAAAATSAAKAAKAAAAEAEIASAPEGSALPPLWETRVEGGKPAFFNSVTNSSTNKRPPAVQGGMLLDEMGLGKTLQVLALAAARPPPAALEPGAPVAKRVKTEGPTAAANAPLRGGTLVLCPTSVLFNWVDQAQAHFAPGVLPVYAHHGTARKRMPADIAAAGNLVVSTYGTLVAESGEGLAAIDWHRVVLDEAHIIRNTKTKTHKAVRTLRATHRWAVTGTPFVNRPEDIQALFAFLQAPPVADSEVFCRAITRPIREGNDAGLTRLRVLLRSLSLRRSKATTIAKELPPRTDEERIVALGPAARQAYDTLFAWTSRVVAALGEHVLQEYSSVLELLLRLRQVAAGGVALVPAERLAAAERVLSDSASPKSHGDGKPAVSADEARDLLRRLKAALSGSDEGGGQVSNEGDAGAGTFECCICLEVEAISEATAIRSCGHAFCNQCTRRLLQQAMSCPMCRGSLRKEDIVAYTELTAAAAAAPPPLVRAG
uniref:Uncharacterized protein n=1 Tax=Rhizochromulina marina TaxID=1034831 RepID=A0A7S2SCS7_9STRA